MPPKTARKLKDKDHENSPKISSFFSKSPKPAGVLKRYEIRSSLLLLYLNMRHHVYTQERGLQTKMTPLSPRRPRGPHLPLSPRPSRAQPAGSCPQSSWPGWRRINWRQGLDCWPRDWEPQTSVLPGSRPCRLSSRKPTWRRCGFRIMLYTAWSIYLASRLQLISFVAAERLKGKVYPPGLFKRFQCYWYSLLSCAADDVFTWTTAFPISQVSGIYTASVLRDTAISSGEGGHNRPGPIPWT